MWKSIAIYVYICTYLYVGLKVGCAVSWFHGLRGLRIWDSRASGQCILPHAATLTQCT